MGSDPVSRRGPSVAVLGVATLVGAGIVAAVKLWPGDGASATQDAQAAPIDATKQLTDDEVRDRIRSYDARMLELVADGDCAKVDELSWRAAAESPRVVQGMHSASCQPRVQPDPAKIYAMPATGTMTFGPSDAPVTIVTSADYGCPFCQLAKPYLSILRKKYPQDVRVVVRSRVVHDWAIAGSYGACAAAHQGEAPFDRFEERLYGRLIRTQKALVMPFDDAGCTATTCPKLGELAAAAGLDVDRFAADLPGCAVEEASAERDWARFGVAAVPAYFVNGRFMSGARGDALDRLVEDELAKAKERIAAGASRAHYYAEWVMARGAVHGDPYVKPVLRVVDPTSSAIAARLPDGKPVWVEALRFAYGGARTSDDAYVQAKLAFAGDAAAARKRADRVATYFVEHSTAGAIARIAQRLHDGEAAVVGTPDADTGAWWLVRRVAKPPIDPLDSTEVLAREQPKIKSVVVVDVLLGWADVPTPAPASHTRSRAELQSLVSAVKLDLGSGLDDIARAASLSEGTRDKRRVAPDDAVDRVDQLALRLAVNEIGVVRSDDGMHVVRRVE